MEEKIMDIIYFGYEDDSTKLEKEFIDEVKIAFPNVILKNAYDSIKGYRREVHLDKSDEDNYCSFLIGKGWFEMSLTLQISMLDKAEHEKFNKWFNLAKKQYPEAFKPEE